MSFDEFIKLVKKKKQENPFLFDDHSDIKADEGMIARAESGLGAFLPEQYKLFVKEFGGGYFATTNIFSVDESGEWFIIKKNKEGKSYLPSNFVAVSDDETGGMYGFIASKEGVCDEAICYWDHESGSVSSKMYSNLFEYLVHVGLTH